MMARTTVFFYRWDTQYTAPPLDTSFADPAIPCPWCLAPLPLHDTPPYQVFEELRFCAQEDHYRYKTDLSLDTLPLVNGKCPCCPLPKKKSFTRKQNKTKAQQYKKGRSHTDRSNVAFIECRSLVSCLLFIPFPPFFPCYIPPRFLLTQTPSKQKRKIQEKLDIIINIILLLLRRLVDGVECGVLEEVRPVPQALGGGLSPLLGSEHRDGGQGRNGILVQVEEEDHLYVRRVEHRPTCGQQVPSDAEVPFQDGRRPSHPQQATEHHRARGTPRAPLLRAPPPRLQLA